MPPPAMAESKILTKTSILFKPTKADNQVHQRYFWLDDRRRTIRIGRASMRSNAPDFQPAEDNMWIPCPVMSRDHALLQLHGDGKVTITDTNSAHGTLLGDEILNKGCPYRLQTGSCVTFGSTVVREHETFHPPSFSVTLHTPSPTNPNKPSNSSYSCPEASDDDSDRDSLYSGSVDESEASDSDSSASDEILQRESSSQRSPAEENELLRGDAVTSSPPPEPRQEKQLSSASGGVLPSHLYGPPTSLPDEEHENTEPINISDDDEDDDLGATYLVDLTSEMPSGRASREALSDAQCPKPSEFGPIQLSSPEPTIFFDPSAGKKEAEATISANNDASMEPTHQQAEKTKKLDLASAPPAFFATGPNFFSFGDGEIASSSQPTASTTAMPFGPASDHRDRWELPYNQKGFGYTDGPFAFEPLGGSDSSAYLIPQSSQPHPYSDHIISLPSYTTTSSTLRTTSTMEQLEVLRRDPTAPQGHDQDELQKPNSSRLKNGMSIGSLINDEAPTSPRNDEAANPENVALDPWVIAPPAILATANPLPSPATSSASPPGLKRKVSALELPLDEPVMDETNGRVTLPCRKSKTTVNSVKEEVPTTKPAQLGLEDTKASAPSSIAYSVEERPARRRRIGLEINNWVSAAVGLVVGTLTTGWVLGSVDAGQHFFA